MKAMRQYIGRYWQVLEIKDSEEEFSKHLELFFRSLDLLNEARIKEANVIVDTKLFSNNIFIILGE